MRGELQGVWVSLSWSWRGSERCRRIGGVGETHRVTMQGAGVCAIGVESEACECVSLCECV